MEISESSLEAKCSNSVTRNFVSSKQSDIFEKESKNVSNVDLCKVPKSKLHLTKKQTMSDFQFQLTMKLITTQVCPNQICPDQVCPATFAPTQVCPDPNLPKAKFAQTQVCPGQICPDPYLPKPNLPRAKFVPKRVYVSKNHQNCQISMD